MTHIKEVAQAVKRSMQGIGTPADTLLILKHIQLAKIIENSYNRPKEIEKAQQLFRAQLLEQLKA